MTSYEPVFPTVKKKNEIFSYYAPLTVFKFHILRNCGDEKTNFLLHHILKGLNFPNRWEIFFRTFWEPICGPVKKPVFKYAFKH